MLFGEAWSSSTQDLSSLKSNSNSDESNSEDSDTDSKKSSTSLVNKQHLKLEESPECYLVFPDFLRYLYTAEIQINIHTAIGILCLADKYNVDSLKVSLIYFFSTVKFL